VKREGIRVRGGGPGRGGSEKLSKEREKKKEEIK